ncbi:RagB/SusD family nutrient uptake outer membrane protein [Hoylesella timonensis]|uniref:RagB/SusD family nutrient uptake outer membrane protein n=1 Tax=Hoylesella timonensis TaxID=386414 RepID=UPI00288BFCDC|nr:RagB/SusD family nutrient uptake outer membrane protein [Hoylesella timonensis]
MKTINYITVALVFASLCSCSLDREPMDALGAENYFNNRSELATFTNGFYADFPSADALYGETADLIIPTSLTNEVMGTRAVPSSGGGWSWSSLVNINTFMDCVAKCPDAAARKEYEGVARFFRAYFYFNKLKRFGAVPWFETQLGSTDDRLYAPRTSRDELLENILKDINCAIESLPNAVNAYRVTKWTALALKSRIFLYEGTFRKYHGIAGYETWLKEAASAAEAFVSDSPYTLHTGSAEPYRQLFVADNALKDEVILARNYNLKLNIVHSVNQYFLTGGAKPGMNKKIVDSYLMMDGTRFTDKKDYRELDYYDEMQGRDPRLSQTIVAPGHKRIGSNTVVSPNFASATTGYQISKWVSDGGQDSYNKAHTDIILFRAAEVYLNLAEAKAELGTLTQADLDRTISKLRARVGMPPLTMATANANPDPYLMSAETGYPQVDGPNKGVILEIRRERTIELFGEGFRYDDLMRWKEGKAFEKQFRGMYVPALDPEKKFVVLDLNGNGKSDALDVCVYDGEQVPTENMYPELSGISTFLKLGDNIELEHGAKGGNIIVHDIRKKPRKWNEGRDYLYPIPQDQVTLYGGKLTQNPNW